MPTKGLVVTESVEDIRSRIRNDLITNPDEDGGGSDGGSSLSGLGILSKLDVPGNWSGKGQHVEFARSEAIPLEQGEFLGRGTFADVHEVTCKGFVFARKQIHCSRRMKIEDVKRELDILKKLSHKHVVTLLGSYTKNKILGLLLHPVAVCDLGVFLDELDEYQRLDPPRLGESLEKLMDRLGFPRDVHRARERLNRVYGCLANAVQYLHEHDIRHKDIKPRNILLDRNDGLYITDFGLSRDTADASSSVTNGIERGTYKYCAPEVARYEPRGRAADVYSLGCVFLEINTVHRRLSLAAFDDFRTENEDRSFQNNPQKLLEWMSKLRQISIDIPDSGVFDMVDIIEKMVSPDPSNRPVIGAVCSSLYVLGDLVYFGECCATPRYQALVNEKGHLKRQYALLQKSYEQTCAAFEAKVSFLEETYQRRVRTIYTDRDENLAQMERYHEDKRTQHLTDLQAKHEDQLRDIDVRHKEEKTAIAEAHKKELSGYKSDMAAALNTNQDQINPLEDSFATKLENFEYEKHKLDKILDEERVGRLALQMKYDELSVTRKADDKQTFDNRTHQETDSEPSTNLKFDRDIGSEVETGSEVRQAMKEENPTDGQSSSLARTLSQRDMGDEFLPVVNPFSIARWISKGDMGGKMSPAEESFPIARKISLKRDKLPAIGRRWSIEAVNGAEFGTPLEVEAEFGTPLEVEAEFETPLEVDTENWTLPMQPRRKQITRKGFFERVKQKLQH